MCSSTPSHSQAGGNGRENNGFVGDDSINDSTTLGNEDNENSREIHRQQNDNSTSNNFNSGSSIRTTNTISGELPKWYPKWKGKPIYDGNPEVLAWVLCSVAESVQYIGSGAFFVNTVLHLALISTRCHTKVEESGGVGIEQCGPTLGDINPSSLLAMYATVIGVCSAAFLPLTGAIIDYTPHRRLIGRISSMIFVLLQIPTIFLKMSNYPTILFMHGLAMFVGWIQMSMLFAYLPELTSDEIKLAQYTKSITIWTFASMMLYLIFVIGLVQILGRSTDGIFINSLGMGTAFAINAIFFPIAWGLLFKRRESLHPREMIVRPSDGKVVPENSLFRTGFQQLWKTVKKIMRDYHSLKWFYVAIAFSEAGGTAFSVVAITYMTTALKLSATQNAIALCLWLFGSIPGAFLSTKFARRFDPVNSSRVQMVLIMMNVLLFAFLTEPGKVGTTYAIMFSCGISGGWKNNIDRLVSSSIIPENQEAEMMGVYLFAGQSLTWLPLILFTAMSEAGIKPKVNVATLDVYLALSLASYILIGGYPKAREQVRRETVYGSARSEAKVDDIDEEDGHRTQESADDAKSRTKGDGDSEIFDDNECFTKTVVDQQKKIPDSQRTAATAVADGFSER